MTTRRFMVVAYEGGVPKTGVELDLGFLIFRKNGSNVTKPTWVEIGISGVYETDPVTLVAGDELVVVADLGDGRDPQYVPLGPGELPVVHGDDWALADVLAARLATDHGAGLWGAAGDGAESVTLQVRDASNSVGLGSAQVDVRNGGTLVANGRTDSGGHVTFLLDPGTYSARVTRGGYSFSAAAIVVSHSDTVAPAHVDGAALPVPDPTAIIGLTRTLSLDGADAPNCDGVIGCVSGDSLDLARAFLSCPAPITAVVSTWKRAEEELDDYDPDTDLQLSWVVTDNGADGTGAATLTLTPDQTQRIAENRLREYDVQVTCGVVKTPERGRWNAIDGVT